MTTRQRNVLDNVDGSQFRRLDNRERVRQGNLTATDFINNVATDYDLTPLNQFLGLRSISFLDRTGGSDDFVGTDFWAVDGTTRLRCQDKRRTSLQGKDLGVEFVRMYRKREGEQFLIITDGGRDLYRIPQTPIIGVQRRCGLVAKREWLKTETLNDLIILHVKHSEDLIWLRSRSVKDICKGLFNRWLNVCKPDTEMYNLVLRCVFGNQINQTFNKELQTNYDVKCLREAKDMKLVALEANDESPTKCMIAKAIAYLPIGIFKEGSDYIVCPKRS